MIRKPGIEVEAYPVRLEFLDCRVGDWIGDEAAQRRDAAQRIGEREVVVEDHVGARQRCEAVQDGMDEASTGLGRVLRRDEAQQCSLEIVSRRERGDAVLRQRGTQASEELLGDPGAADTHPAQVRAQARGVRRADLSGGVHRRCGVEELRDVGVQRDRVAQRCELLAQLGGERVHSGGVEDGHQRGGAVRGDVVAEQQTADLAA